VKQDQVPFLEHPSAKRGNLGRRQCLIYVIPGNPGLITYYEPFMKTLRELLGEVEAKEECRRAFHIYGRNLLGFDDSDHDPPFGCTSAAGVTTEPFTLEDQIRGCCERVQEANKTLLGAGRVFDEVVLIGHSVGAYICLEIFNRHHQAIREQHSSPWGDVNLKAGILLFPTVSHIAQSSSGQKLDLIRRTPFLDRSAHHIAKGFVNLWPHWLLATVLRRCMGFPAHAAAATLRFLTSRDGIWQALHMGKDEMKTITEEKWSEELWEIQEVEEEEESSGDDEAAGFGAKFFFYFAQKDHWVADECRDEFIEKRRRHEKGRTKIVIDEEKIPHAFCIRKWHPELQWEVPVPLFDD
jgi:pimeloyl-ACP methyl ester carboxylesterase